MTEGIIPECLIPRRRDKKAIPIYFSAPSGWKIDLRLISFLTSPTLYNSISGEEVKWIIDCSFNNGYGRLLSFNNETEALALHTAWVEYLKTQTIYI
jgi:hypothetical protein